MLDILKERRSIRKYESQDIEEDKVAKVIAAGKMAPSGKNKRPVEFILVKDKDILKEMSTAKPKGGLFLEGAPVGIVVIGREDLSDTWIEDCSIATTFIQLEAHNQGLGSCWIQIRERFDAEKKVKELLGIDEKKRVLCIVALGYPDEVKKAYLEKDFI